MHRYIAQRPGLLAGRSPILPMTKLAPLPPVPPDPTVGQASVSGACGPALQLALVEAVLEAKGLGAALRAVADLLAGVWQAQDWSLLRVDDWNGKTGLVYPWE